MPERVIRTDALARVEGEGAMYVRLREGDVDQVQLRIYEPPRFFEGLLRGRLYTEPPDITARICGICPVAYQMSAIAAIEDALGVTVPEPVRLLRRLIYCGEWIESHCLHLFMLHAPDFLSYESAIAMARDHADIVELGLGLKKAGNAIVSLVGGREVHPINVRVGGFYRAPERRELRKLADTLERAREDALEAVRWTASLDFPELECDWELVALSQPGEYPLERGRLSSSEGLDIAPAEFDEHFVEEQVEHSTALHARVRARGAYLTGPLARYGLNSDRLSPLAREAASDAGLGGVVTNPFRSIMVRAVEVLYAFDEALRIIESYEAPDPPAVETEPKAGTGHGWTEAPRGMLYLSYRLDEAGVITAATIVPPTSQNQRRMEEDLRAFVSAHAHLPDEELQMRCEQAIRNYDPCISCSTHFLRLEIDRK